MRSPYLTVYSASHGEVTEKRSRFLGDLVPAADEAEASAFIESIRKKHPDARHHCFAFIAGSPETVRVSDDGEPSQTAGMPILQVLEGASLHGVCLVVTRYFGGILLGPGGLGRAYAAAASAAVSNARLIERVPAFECSLDIPYAQIGRLRSLIANTGSVSVSEDFAETARYSLLVPDSSLSTFTAAVTELTSGNSELIPGRQVFFSLADGRAEIFAH